MLEVMIVIGAFGLQVAEPPVKHDAMAFPEPIVFNDDGGWCWFQDERAIIKDGVLWFGSVAAGIDDASRRGDIELTRYDIATGATTVIELHDQLQRDDHNAPALIPIADGGLLAVYAKHGNDAKIRMRRVHADGSLNGLEQVVEPGVASGHGVTYANVYRLAAENGGQGRLYDFYRGEGWDPNALVSDDNGATWRQVGQLLAGPGRPYVRYAGNGRDTVHFFCTDQHPRDFDNSLYYGFVRDGGVWNGAGERIGTLGKEAPTHEQLTSVFTGSADAVAWPCDVELDDAGLPRVVYTVQVDGAGKPRASGGMDHRFRFAWFDGAAWHDEEIAYAGTRLYAGEDDYTGLAAIDPIAPGVVFISTDAHPTTGEPLVSATDGQRHREIFRGHRTDQDKWVWQAVTSNSSVDQVRPIVTQADGDVRAVLWLSGTMKTYQDYDFDVVGYIVQQTDDAALSYGADRVRIEVDHELMTSFVFGTTDRPYLYPVIGPGGVPMTRAYPQEDRSGESHDRPHHTSMWFAHGDINGHDFWHGPARFEVVGEVHPDEGGIRADYQMITAEGTTIGTYALEVGFAAAEQTRSITIQSVFAADAGEPLRFGDTKEGTFAMRTHPSLRLEPDERAGVTGVTGNARNSEGVTGQSVWGKRAAWVDYWGEIEGQRVGVAIFDHPSNPRHPTWWQARAYGLIAANPFGTSAFEGGEPERGAMELAPGETLRFLHRFVFHRGSTDEARVKMLYDAWSQEPVD